MAAATNVVPFVDSRGRPLARYDAANISRRTAGWTTSSGSGPNREIHTDLGRLIDRHRDLARNNPWARRAIGAIVNNWVGSGILAQWGSARRQKRWSSWFSSTRIDADGRFDGYGLQSLIARTVVESGAALVRKRPRFASDGLVVPLQLQVLEPDWIDRSKNETLSTGGYIIQGIEFDALGRRVAYWLFSHHPGDAVTLRLINPVSSRYDAREILHIYRVDRPGQVHGVPWGTGSMLRLRMLDDYQDAQLERQRLAACYAVFVRDSDAGEPSSADYSILDKLEPGAIEFLPPGKDVSFASPPQPENDEHFVLQILTSVAADYGIPYEVMTGDLSRVNFSSARMGYQEFGRSIESWRWQVFGAQLLAPIAEWYLEAEAVAGYTGRPEMPLWTAPSRQIVDPAREIPAIRDAVRSGLMSLPQAIRSMGFDPVVLAQEHAAFLVVLDSLGIAFDSDARHGTNGPPADPAKQPNHDEIEDREETDDRN